MTMNCSETVSNMERSSRQPAEGFVTDDVDRCVKAIMRRFNPTGQALAAQAWTARDGTKGWGPVCTNKGKIGCQRLTIPKGSCSTCAARKYTNVSEDLVRRHVQSSNEKIRYGMYPVLAGNRTAWVALDLDNHVGHKNPEQDARALLQATDALGVPLYLFSSNSGTGFHPYIFFSGHIPARKARALMLTLAERASIDLAPSRDGEGSFDAVFPKQDQLDFGKIGNLIAMPGK